MGNGVLRQQPVNIEGDTFPPHLRKLLNERRGIISPGKAFITTPFGSYVNYVGSSSGRMVQLRPPTEYKSAMLNFSEKKYITLVERLDFINTSLKSDIIIRAFQGDQTALDFIAKTLLLACTPRKDGEIWGMQFLQLALDRGLVSDSFKKKLTIILHLPGLYDTMVRHPLARDIQYGNRNYASQEAINTFFRGVFSQQTFELLVDSLTPRGSWRNWRENPNLGTFTLLVGDTLLTLAIVAKPLATAGKASLIAGREIALACNLVRVERAMVAAERAGQTVARTLEPLKEIATTMGILRGGKETWTAIKAAFQGAKEWKGFTLAGLYALTKGGWFVTKTTLKTGFMLWLYSPELVNLFDALRSGDQARINSAVSRFKGAMGLYELGFGLFNKALVAGNQKYQEFIRTIYSRIMGDKIMAAKLMQYLKQYMAGTANISTTLSNLERLFGMKFNSEQVTFLTKILTEAKTRSVSAVKTIFDYFKGKASTEQLEASLGFRSFAAFPYAVGGALGLSWFINSIAEARDNATVAEIRDGHMDRVEQRITENAMMERQRQFTVMTPKPDL